MPRKAQTPDAVIAFLEEAAVQAEQNVQTLNRNACEEYRPRAYQILRLSAANALGYEASLNLEALMHACAKVLRNPAQWGEAGVDLAHNVLLTIARSL